MASHGKPRRRRQYGLDAFADGERAIGRPQLDHAHLPQRLAFELGHVAVDRLRPMRWMPTGASLSGSRISARMQGAVSEPNGQRGWKRRLSWISAGSLPMSIAPGLAQVALAKAAEQRVCGIPQRHRCCGLIGLGCLAAVATQGAGGSQS